MADQFKACCIEGCKDDAKNGRRGMCSRHYYHWKAARSSMLGCSVSECRRSLYAKGLCSAHYQRWKDHGDPLGGRVPNGETHRYLREVVLSYDGDECHIWPFFRDHNGYAKVNGLKDRYVSRIACEAHNGPAPSKSLHAAHSCGNGRSGCVTKKHLRWATVTENQQDRVLHGTSNRGERSATAILTEADVIYIRDAVKDRTQADLARSYGVHQTTISDIITRRRWSWL